MRFIFLSPLLSYPLPHTSFFLLLGMGLNLSIGRIIFSSLDKYDGIAQRRLTHAEIKQIAGRAGRFKGKYEVSHIKKK
jgi:hypothetical protein